MCETDSSGARLPLICIKASDEEENDKDLCWAEVMAEDGIECWLLNLCEMVLKQVCSH